ncbi:putative Serine protease inhibitor [Daphnia magna]|uniref:Putative Serine protease inhibitor n=1 Tax=Daphnia magna TaxID=35525 RepID=A0A162CJH2_9CRUS|nr:putative Serine protease inhibitor [Daphnia magna]
MSNVYVLLLCLIAFASAAPQGSLPLFVQEPMPINPVCLLAPINPRVRCNNFSLKWYYDARTRDCEKILYSGCGGSKNLFNSENACERLCDHDNFDSYESDEDFHDYPLPTYKYFSIGK